MLQGGNGSFSLANSGTIAMSGQNQLTQLMCNDSNMHQALFLSQVGTMIYGQGVISNFARFVNDGTLVAELGPLEVQAPLGNWNSATGTLTGGTYLANSGALGLDSLGSGAALLPAGSE